MAQQGPDFVEVCRTIILKGPFKSSTPVILDACENRALTRISLKDKMSKFRLL